MYCQYSRRPNNGNKKASASRERERVKLRRNRMEALDMPGWVGGGLILAQAAQGRPYRFTGIFRGPI